MNDHDIQRPTVEAARAWLLELTETEPWLEEGEALLYGDRALIHEGSPRVRVERGVSCLRSLLLAAAHCIERHEGERKRDGK
mgnify:CR=1 FL=1